jgi:hypothetical protein
MANLNLDKAEVSDYSSLDAYEIDTKMTDGVSDQDETEWMNTKASQYFGYFNAVPELKNAILLKGLWIVGKGYKCERPSDEIRLSNISGWGKDTFKQILYNMVVCMRIYGDAFAEIIRNEKGTLINIKPLDPMSMKIVCNREGIIMRYEQVNKIGMRQTIKKFKPEEILHFSHNRLADQIHGISDIESIEPIILAEQESFTDLKKVMHFQAKPFIVFKLKTDDEDKIKEFADKVRKARSLGEDMFIPDDENLLSYEVVVVNPSQILMQWRDDLRNKFYRTIGLPQIVPGGAGQSTESESKVIYVAFEQIVMHEQLDIEQMIYNQLGIKLNLVHPTLIEDLLGIDEKKDAGNNLKIQPGEMTPGKDKG